MDRTRRTSKEAGGELAEVVVVAEERMALASWVSVVVGGRPEVRRRTRWRDIPKKSGIVSAYSKAKILLR